MTREERNRKISELRGEWLVPLHVYQGDLTPLDIPGFCIDYCALKPSQHPHPGTAKDWHADTNWPTLLREIVVKGGWCAYFTISQDGSGEFETIFHTTGDDLAIQSDEIGDHVCEAWLKWKAGLSENGL